MAAEITRSIQAYQQTGASHVVLSMHTDEVNKIHDMMERFAQQVMPAFVVENP